MRSGRAKRQAIEVERADLGRTGDRARAFELARDALLPDDPRRIFGARHERELPRSRRPREMAPMVVRGDDFEMGAGRLNELVEPRRRRPTNRKREVLSAY